MSGPLFKLNPFLNTLKANCEKLWWPGQFLSLDKQTIGFRGRSKWKLRIKYKKEGDGFQADALCEQGYTWSFVYRFEKVLETPHYVNYVWGVSSITMLFVSYEVSAINPRDTEVGSFVCMSDCAQREHPQGGSATALTLPAPDGEAAKQVHTCDCGQPLQQLQLLHVGNDAASSCVLYWHNPSWEPVSNMSCFTTHKSFLYYLTYKLV
jgi:hypothetical protein